MRRLLPVLSLLALAVVPVLAESGPATDYFPLVPGTVWVYRTNVGPDLVMRVSGSGQVNGTSCTVVESLSNNMITQRECFRRDGGIVYAHVRAYPQGNVLLVPPQPMLVLPPRMGHSWVWEGRAGTAPAAVQLTWARTERVNVPAGAYATAQLYLEGSVGPERVQSWRWFAPGVGMVKEDSIAEVTDGRTIRIYAELREYRPGR